MNKLIKSYDLRNNRLFLFSFLLLIILSLSSLHEISAQNNVNSVSGIVTDESGEPIIGVTVLLEGTTQGTITDIEGNYTLKDASINSVLVFSFIGMETTHVKVISPITNVKMKASVHSLDDVVVVGYGVVKKEELTSAVTKVDAESFNSGVTSNPINLIAGKVPGLTIRNTSGNDPNASPEILLRGVGTIRGGSSPLILIDGVNSTTNELKALNPTDIESFNVLKDASSAAIYGTRGSNGVIIVQTKKAAQGRAEIKYTSYYYTERPTNEMKMMSADQYLGYLDSRGHSTVDNDYGFSTNWEDELIQNNFGHHQALSFATSDDNSATRVSVGYYDREGMVINTGSEQVTARINFKQYFYDKKLTIEGSASGSLDNRDYTDYGAFNQAMVYHPTAPVYDSNGDYFEFEGVGPYNPVAVLNQVDNRGEYNNFIGSLSAKLNILENLTLNTQVSSNIENYEASKYVSSESRYSELGDYSGSASTETHFYKKNMLEVYGTYTLTEDNHNATILGGYSYNDENNVWHNAYNANFLTDIPGANNIGGGTYLEEGRATMGRGQDQAKLIAFFGRVNYSFMGKYLFNASIRREGSTKFGENNKWGTFPAVSGGWRINEEGFMNDVDVINNLKLRAGYGVTGNQDIPKYASLAMYNERGYAYYNNEWSQVFGPTTNGNPDLRWEKNAEFNVGIDFGILDNRVSGNIDYYYRKTTDLLDWYSAQVPSSIYNSIFTNVGTLTNEGVELALSYKVIDKGDWLWNVNGTVAYNKNELQSLSNSSYKANHILYNTLSSPANGQTTYILEEGKPIGTYYGLKYKGFTEAGKWVFEDVNNDGQYTVDDYQFLGNGMPKATFNFNSSLNWKNFDFSFLLRGAVGFDVLNTKRIYYENSVSLPFNLLESTLDSPLNDAAVYSDYYLEKGDYLKIANVSLGYTLKTEKLKYFSGLRLYVTASELATFTSYSGYDPEVGTGLTQGYDGPSYYPRSSTYMLGLNIDF